MPTYHRSELKGNPDVDGSGGDPEPATILVLVEEPASKGKKYGEASYTRCNEKDRDSHTMVRNNTCKVNKIHRIPAGKNGEITPVFHVHP